MPTRSSVICLLNSNYKKALSLDRFKIEDGSILDTKNDEHTHISTGSTECCGIDELNFTSIQDSEYENEFSNELWECFIAKYIKGSCTVSDQRIVFVGLPVKVGNHSMYKMNFYEKLFKTLKKFGFRELCKPYKNKSSGNTITVLAGQIPE